MIKIITAYDKNKLIGNNNSLPWKINQELLFFKNTTINKTILMGDKTFLGINKVLPNRKTIILTLDKNFKNNDSNVSIETNYINIIEKYWNNKFEDIYICGGATIYKLFLPFADELIISKINNKYRGDVYFPEWNKEDFILSNKENFEEFTVHRFERKKGKLNVYYGPMFSGKSSHLIDDIRLCKEQHKLVFKPKIDTRSNSIFSRDKKQENSITIEDSNEIFNFINTNTKNIFIDELQFFSKEILFVINKILFLNINVTVAGLDTDFKKNKFGPILDLEKISQKFTLLKNAKCHFCGKPARWTVRLINEKLDSDDSPVIIPDSLNESEVKYQCSCEECYPK